MMMASSLKLVFQSNSQNSLRLLPFSGRFLLLVTSSDVRFTLCSTNLKDVADGMEREAESTSTPSKKKKKNIET